MKRARGSAIVIAILIITAIGTIAFYFGRVLLFDATNTALIENGVGAYYAAESGVEEGFLRYRLYQNTEVPFEQWTPGENRFYRSTLSNICNSDTDPCVQTGSSDQGIDKYKISAIDPTTQSYDLRMGSKVSKYSNGTIDYSRINDPNLFVDTYATDPNSVYRIKRDEAKKFDLSNIFQPGSDVHLSFGWTNPAGVTLPITDPKCGLVEVKLTGRRGVTLQEFKKLLYNPDPSCSYEGIFPKDDSVFGYTSDSGLVSIDNFKTTVFGSQQLDNAVLTLKPIGVDIDLEIIPMVTSAIQVVYGPYSNIQSIGHFGGATRTIEANIDRQSGTLYDLFDYVIYKGPAN